MPRVGSNQNWVRFNLIVKKTIDYLNLPEISQPEFIAMFYNWVDGFSERLSTATNIEEYKTWLIYRGLSNTYSGITKIPAIDLPHGLLNNEKNRKKAAKRLQENFRKRFTREQLLYLNSKLLNYFKTDEKSGYVATYVKRVNDVNGDSFADYIFSYLVPALELIDDPYERFAAILIYAQSGCIPLDVKEIEIEKRNAYICELQDKIEYLSELKEQSIYDVYHSHDFHELTDSHFHGTFYGYFRQYTSGDGQTSYKGLTPFELKIENTDNSGVVATLSFSRYNPAMAEIPVKLTGKPMLGHETIQIVFQAEKGDDLVTMSYNWIEIKDASVQCRSGVLITQHRADRSPQVQKFIFFNQPISEENEKYVDAYLRLCDDRFIILDEGIEKLSDESTDFLKKYGKKVTGYLASVKNLITAAQIDNMDDRQIAKHIMEIKGQSAEPLVINSKEEKQIMDLFRSFLTEQKQNYSSHESPLQ